MNPVSTQVSAEVRASRDEFFYWFTSVDLSDVMNRYGPIPGVIGIEDQTGPMHVPGSSRVLRLSDGSTATEEVTSCDPPVEVMYRLNRLTGFFGHLVAEARGALWFDETQGGGTRLKWRYTFFCRSLASTVFMRMLVPLLWRGFMQSALTRSKHLAEARFSDPS